MKILNFKQFINEHYLNLFTPEEKAPYADQVWDLLQATYAYAGGIKGSGFKSKEDMIQNIPFWKLTTKDGKVTTCRMYKDKEGRKGVAAGTDGTRDSVKAYREITKEDLKRAFIELSGKALNSLQKQLGDDFYKYDIPVKIAQQKLPDDELIPIDDYFYQRDIGGEMVTKVMVGNPNAKKITVPR